MKRSKMRKRGTEALTVVYTIVIVLIGIFALKTMVQQEQAIARDKLPGGRFNIEQEELSAVSGNNCGETDRRSGMSASEEIYVENFDTNVPIFVRVRLYEYLETGPGAELDPTDPDFMAREAEPLIAGADRLNTATWTAILPDPKADSDSAQFRNYWMLTRAGGSKSYAEGKTFDAKIMTMAEWNTAGQPVGNIWVLDTDGWVYWASPLESGEATGLLINERTYIYPIVSTMFYAICADAQFATTSQLPMAWGSTASNAPMSTAAAALVKIITNAPVTEVTPANWNWGLGEAL